MVFPVASIHRPSLRKEAYTAPSRIPRMVPGGLALLTVLPPNFVKEVEMMNKIHACDTR